MKIGVLALQGDFAAHCRALERLGAQTVEVRTAGELEECSALVIPGGESTTMLRLLRQEDLLEALRRFGDGRPIFGTCAGAILLATEVTGPAQESLGLVDIGIERNAYGRQMDSRVIRLTPEEASGGASRWTGENGAELEAVFIRAPIIRRVGKAVNVLVRYQGDPVLVEQGLHLVATFHPELSADSRVHGLFLDKAASCDR